MAANASAEPELNVFPITADTNILVNNTNAYNNRSDPIIQKLLLIIEGDDPATHNVTERNYWPNPVTGEFAYYGAETDNAIYKFIGIS